MPLFGYKSEKYYDNPPAIGGVKWVEDLKEIDPNGVDQHEAGAKLDAGKPRVALVLKGFANALWEVSRVGTFGAEKYTPFGWKEVKDGEERYDDALMRHKLKDWMGERVDDELPVLHQAQVAWNALAKLELMVQDYKRDG